MITALNDSKSDSRVLYLYQYHFCHNMFVHFLWIPKNVLTHIHGYNCVNKPIPSSLVPLFKSESENDFDLRENETACRTHFHMKGFALRLVLKYRHKRTRKWPIKEKYFWILVNSDKKTLLRANAYSCFEKGCLYKRETAYLTTMSKIIMGYGGFYGYLSEAQVVFQRGGRTQHKY